jgi:hypothetical protein
MTTRMVAPEQDMLSAVVHGMTYEIKKHDSLGRVVDVNDVHIHDFKAMGFKLPEELGPMPAIELKSGPTEEELAAEAEAQAKIVAEQEEADRIAAEKADEEKAAAEKEAADKEAADKLAAEQAASKADDEPAKKGKHK